MQQPKWNELRAKNLNTRKSKILGVILHDTAGSATHNDTLYLAHPGDGRPVSVDFTVERDGSIWKLNPDLMKFCCNHAGRATSFKNLRNGQVNHATVGIEIVQKVNLSLKPLYPEAQVRSVAELCAWLTEEFGLTSADITTHRNVITDGSRSDPRLFPFEGSGGFWQLFWQAKGKGSEYQLSQLIQKTPTSKEEERRQYTVVEGDSLWSIVKRALGEKNTQARIKALVELNPGADKMILPGQVLRLPD